MLLGMYFAFDICVWCLLLLQQLLSFFFSRIILLFVLSSRRVFCYSPVYLSHHDSALRQIDLRLIIAHKITCWLRSNGISISLRAKINHLNILYVLAGRRYVFFFVFFFHFFLFFLFFFVRSGLKSHLAVWFDLIGWWKWNEWCQSLWHSLAVPRISLNGLIGYLLESREFFLYIYGFLYSVQVQMSYLIDLFKII